MARYTFTPLRLGDARAMASWRYEGEYSFYNTGLFPLLLVVPLRWLLASMGVEVYAVRDESKEVAGTFSYTRQHDSVEIGLAMRPDLTGRGLGLDFVRAGMDFARERFAPRAFTLDVATFNLRAIKVYQRAGFVPVATFKRSMRQGPVEFLAMSCSAA